MILSLNAVDDKQGTSQTIGWSYRAYATSIVFGPLLHFTMTAIDTLWLYHSATHQPNTELLRYTCTEVAADCC